MNHPDVTRVHLPGPELRRVRHPGFAARAPTPPARFSPTGASGDSTGPVQYRYRSNSSYRVVAGTPACGVARGGVGVRLSELSPQRAQRPACMQVPGVDPNVSLCALCVARGVHRAHVHVLCTNVVHVHVHVQDMYMYMYMYTCGSTAHTRPPFIFGHRHAESVSRARTRLPRVYTRSLVHAS